MKKFIFPVIALTALGTASAQEAKTEGFKKGDVFISGNVGINTRKEDGAKNTNWYVSPNVGYFVNDKIALGAQVTYGSQETKATGDYPYNPFYENESLSAGLFGRYYFMPGSKFSVYGELGANYIHTKNNGLSSFSRIGNGFDIHVGPGINYFVSPRFALQSYIGLLSYGSAKIKGGGYSTTSETFSIGLNSSNIAIGLLYKI